MKKIILGSLLLVSCASASAQVTMSGFKPWYIIQGNLQGADVADLEGAKKKGGVTRMMGAHYFPQTVSFKVGQGDKAQTKTADYVVTVKDYKCTTVGSVKTRTEEYYLIGTIDPVYSTGIQYEAPFKIEMPSSAAGRQWTAVCKGTRPADMRPVTIFAPGTQYNIMHETIIKPIRQQIEASKQKLNAPSTQQPVR